MSENTKNKRKLIVTSALPYANSSLHLGHILEAVQTDIWVRFQNQNLNECLYFCADDTHGTPVMLKAQELGLSPEELIKNVKKDHIETYEKYGIDFTNFHSTHSDENKKIAQEIYMSAKENGLIKKKVINQLYDTKESMFLSDRFIKGTCPKCSAEDQYGDGCGVCNAAFSVEELINPISTLSNTKPILKESEHIFFDLPSKSEYIKKFLSEATLQEPIINKLHEWVGDGLKEWDISRDAPYFGFQIPNEPNKFFYVWLDAPIGYIASAMNWSVKKNIDIDDYIILCIITVITIIFSSLYHDCSNHINLFNENIEYRDDKIYKAQIEGEITTFYEDKYKNDNPTTGFQLEQNCYIGKYKTLYTLLHYKDLILANISIVFIILIVTNINKKLRYILLIMSFVFLLSVLSYKGLNKYYLQYIPTGLSILLFVCYIVYLFRNYNSKLKNNMLQFILCYVGGAILFIIAFIFIVNYKPYRQPSLITLQHHVQDET